MNASVSWTPADDKAGRSVQAHVLASDGPLCLTGGDLWRWLMCQLVEAEYNLDAMVWMSGRAVPHPPFVDTKTVGDASSRREVAHALAGSWDPSPDLGREGFFFLGDVPVWMWQAAQRRARTVLRAAHPVAAAPTFRSLEDLASPGPLWNPARLRSSGPATPRLLSSPDGVMRIGPAVLVLLGVLGVAAMAAGGYVGGEAVKQSYAVDREKARLAAETALRSQVVMAKIAAGEPVLPDDVIVSAGKAEERAEWALPVGGFGLGVVAAGAAGVALWRRGKSRDRAS